jgi:hypothetical protein
MIDQQLLQDAVLKNVNMLDALHLMTASWPCVTIFTFNKREFDFTHNTLLFEHVVLKMKWSWMVQMMMTGFDRL